MIVKCDKCGKYLDDEYRFVYCPHVAFPANDGKNNFRVHDDAYLADEPPAGVRERNA